MLLTVDKISDVYFHLLGTKDKKNETTFYTAAGWRCRQNLKNQNFTSSLSRTGTATTKPQINDLIGSMRKNNRAARAARI